MKNLLCLAILSAAFLLLIATSYAERILILNDVEIAKEIIPEGSAREIIREWYGEPESYSHTSGNLIGCCFNPFMATIHSSFSSHRPIEISPDHIWLVLMQGFAAHVNNHSEELRDKFVSHTGELSLMVRRDDFKKGKIDNPWEEVFEEFCKQIEKHVGEDTVNLVTAKFSTTTPTEQAAFELTLMDALGHYFSYEVHSMCGIPSITLEGATQDWKELKERAMQLEKYDLKWWTDELDPILEEFINASEGRVNTEFWNSMYKDKGQSGGPFVTGWISKLFPYLAGKDPKFPRLNPIFETDNPEELRISLESFPNGLSKVPFKWKYYFREYEMIFLSGFVGMSQNHETKAVRPEIGWIIMENPEKKSFLKRLFSREK